MQNYLNQYKNWYESRLPREKLLTLLVSWAVIYALFSLCIFQIQDTRKEKLSGDLKETRTKITSWQNQLNYLNEIPKTPLYKEWVNQHKNYDELKKKYKNLLDMPVSERWSEIIKTILQTYPNITIEKIENDPESAYKNEQIKTIPDTIYEQKMRISVLGNFEDILGYLKSLESTLPNIHWNTLSYEVVEYPNAKVQMEFSILYEKPKA